MRRRRTSTALASIALASVLWCACATASSVALASHTRPPNDTYEINVEPTTVRPGGVLTFTGTCWMNKYLGATTHVNVRGFLKPPAPEAPYDFTLHNLPVDPSDGSYRGQITVPSDAPVGDYTLSGQCVTQDQVPGYGHTPFTVAGEPIPTSSTTSTTTLDTSTTAGAPTTTEPPATEPGPPPTPDPPTAAPLPATQATPVTASTTGYTG